MNRDCREMPSTGEPDDFSVRRVQTLSLTAVVMVLALFLIAADSKADVKQLELKVAIGSLILAIPVSGVVTWINFRKAAKKSWLQPKIAATFFILILLAAASYVIIFHLVYFAFSLAAALMKNAFQ